LNWYSRYREFARHSLDFGSKSLQEGCRVRRDCGMERWEDWRVCRYWEMVKDKRFEELDRALRRQSYFCFLHKEQAGRIFL